MLSISVSIFRPTSTSCADVFWCVTALPAPFRSGCSCRTSPIPPGTYPEAVPRWNVRLSPCDYGPGGDTSSRSRHRPVPHSEGGSCAVLRVSLPNRFLCLLSVSPCFGQWLRDQELPWDGSLGPVHSCDPGFFGLLVILTSCSDVSLPTTVL